MKKTLFKIIAITLPFFLVMLIEVILRISGYGESYLLFNKVTIKDKPDYLEMNPHVAGKYFKNEGFHSDNQFDLFLRTKTDSTFRIFIQGASTVVGFPYYRGGSFPRMLQHRLSQTFPEKNIEVINTGITAVNSYTLWDLTDEIIKQKPDLVIIYAGHNEYYGALGVGAAGSLESNPRIVRTYLSLKSFRFFQLLENSYEMVFSTGDKGPDIKETTLMEVMVREQRISYNSDAYHAGINQFEDNMDRVLGKYKKNEIPVILSTLVCNEKDIRPFISDSIKNEGKFLEDIKEKKTEANQLAQTNAKAAYMLGRYYLREDPDSAMKYLHLAKELDLLRFRAPEEINHVIRGLAKKYNLSLVDMVDVFLLHSPHGIIGDELMTEHVHPNIKGYFIMADAFYNEIKELEFLERDWENYISFDEAFQDIPVTKIDSIKGKLVIEDLKKSWPYDLSMSGARVQKKYYIPDGSYEEKRALDLYTNLENWKDLMVYSLGKYNLEGAYEKALRVAQSLILEYPEEARIYSSAGEICLKLEEFEKAVYYFSKFNQLDKSSVSAQKLASVYAKLNKIELALQTLFEARSKGLNGEGLNDMIKKLQGQLSETP